MARAGDRLRVFQLTPTELTHGIERTVPATVVWPPSHCGIYASQRLAIPKGMGVTTPITARHETLHEVGQRRRRWLPTRSLSGSVTPAAPAPMMPPAEDR